MVPVSKTAAPTTPRDPRVARALEQIRAGESIRQAVRSTGAPRSTVRYWCSKEGLAADPHGKTGGAERKETAADGTMIVEGKAKSPEAVLRRHGIDPDNVVITSERVTEAKDQSWMRVSCKPKAEAALVVPSLDTVTLPAIDLIEPAGFSHGQVVFLADPHLPYLNEPLMRATERFLQDEQPSQIVFLGDAGDHNRISRHRGHPRFIATINETNDAVANYFYRIRMAAGWECEFIFIPGNHDQRILDYMLDHAAEFADVRPGQFDHEEVPPEQLITLNRFYRLDDLGIKHIDEDWKLASYPVVQELTARHGHFTGEGAEKKALEKYGRSQIHGHLHRGEQRYRTKHDPLDIRVSVSVPCMCEVEVDGLGYSPEPDWTPGIGLAHVWDDETFVTSMAPFIKNQLLLPDGRRYSGEE